MSLESHSIAGSKVYYVPDFVTVISVNSHDESLCSVAVVITLTVARRGNLSDSKIAETPQPKWKQLSNRRLQIWGGELNSRNALLSQPLPAFIEAYPPIIHRLRETGAFKETPHHAPNHVILNEYRAGQGILPHEDGPAYFPVVATISLGSHVMFHYYRYKDEEEVSESGRVIDRTPVLSILLEPRSLVISAGEMYSNHLHGIDEVTEDIIIPGDLEQPPKVAPTGVPISNWDRLTDKNLKAIVRNGGVIKRETRYSLTCRDVRHTINSKVLLRR